MKPNWPLPNASYGNCADRPNYGTLKGVFLYMASVQSLNNFMQAAR